MKTYRITIASLVAACLLLSVVVFAQVSRPYRNGSVWGVSYIRVKQGMDTAYLTFLANDWKRLREAEKKEGLILSYKVLETEGHSPTDFNMMLMVEFKDMATFEANEDKEDVVAEKVMGNDQKRMQGVKDRSEMREDMGFRLAREIVLEPKR